MDTEKNITNQENHDADWKLPDSEKIPVSTYKIQNSKHKQNPGKYEKCNGCSYGWNTDKCRHKCTNNASNRIRCI